MNNEITNRSVKLARELFPAAHVSGKPNRVWHFCFAYRGGKLLAVGQNNMSVPCARTTKFYKRFKNKSLFPSRHAELDLISQLWGRYHIDSSLKIVVLRLNKNGELKQSKPCVKCRKILDALNLKKVYFSNDKGKFEKI